MPFYDQVVSVTEVDTPEDVYDIEVEETHNFFADELCVHNCIGGILSKIVFENQDPSQEWRSWEVTDYNMDKIQTELKTVTDRFLEALGGSSPEENYYLELQFNKLRPQHLVNYHLIELARRTGLKLVVTADSHYSNPAHWREREIYKAMAWASKTKGTVDLSTLPQTIDELKCELYPKNAEQIWETYKREKVLYPNVYRDDVDQVVADAVERTHDITHNLIGDVTIDKKVKLPGIGRLLQKDRLESLQSAFAGLSEDDLALKELVRVGIEGLKAKGVAGDDRYVKRLRHELETIKHLKFAKYFLTYKKIIDLVDTCMLIGAGRGSAAGSLLAYVLGITQIDPVRFGLLFERMLTKHKVGYPDIDCLSSNTKALLSSGAAMSLGELEVGDVVLDLNNEPRKVLAVQHRASNDSDDELWTVVVNVNGVYGSFIANHKHRMFLSDGSVTSVGNLEVGAKLCSHGKEAVVAGLVPLESQVELTDITVEGTASFQIIPFNVVVVTTATHQKTLVGINTYSMDTDDYDRPSSTRFELEL